MDTTATKATATPRERAILWARDVVNDPRSVVLDCETTGLGDDAEICDLAIIDIDGRVLLDSLVKPSKPIPPEATAVHGIDDAMVASAPGFAWTFVDAFHLLGFASRCVVYNATYDGGILDRLSLPMRSLAGTAADPLLAEWFQCAMKAYSDFNGTVDDRFPVGVSRFGRRSTAAKFRWWKLTEAAGHFGIEVNGAHRALADALTTVALVRAMAAAED